MKYLFNKLLFPEKLIFKKLDIKEKALLIYIILGGIFISCLIACNLIFLKFFSVKINYLNITFTQSVGLIAYQITFLITDVVSEIYGHKKANYLVLSGIISSVIILGLIYIADILPAAEFSKPSNQKVDDETFNLVFGLVVPIPTSPSLVTVSRVLLPSPAFPESLNLSPSLLSIPKLYSRVPTSWKSIVASPVPSCVICMVPASLTSSR